VSSGRISGDGPGYAVWLTVNKTQNGLGLLEGQSYAAVQVPFVKHAEYAFVSRGKRMVSSCRRIIVAQVNVIEEAQVVDVRIDCYSKKSTTSFCAFLLQLCLKVGDPSNGQT
jgi:hypothetical protein